MLDHINFDRGDKSLDARHFQDVVTFKKELDAVMNKFTIFHMNIRSAYKNFDQFIVLLQCMSTSNIDIIILSECWKIEDLTRYNIDGYITHYNNGSFNKNDGLLVLVKRELNFDIQNIHFSQTTPCLLSVKINTFIFDILALYRPPSSDAQQFVQDLHNYLSSSNKSHIRILVGDINLNLLDLDCQIVNQYINVLCSAGFQSLVNTSTRVTDLTQSCIDHCFVHVPNAAKQKLEPVSYVFETSITDHFSTVLGIRFSSGWDRNVKPQPAFRRVNYVKLEAALQSVNWRVIYSTENVNEATNIFVNAITSSIESATDLITVRNKAKKIKPWMTTGLLTSIRHREKLGLKLRNNFSVELQSEFKTYRNHLNKLISIAKQNYYKHEIDIADNQSKLWKAIKKITNENTKNHTITSIDDIDGKNLVEDDKIANRFNNFFADIGIQIAGNISKDFHAHLPETPLVNKSMFLTPVSRNEIIKYVNQLKNSNSVGPDGISNIIIKKYHLLFLNPLIYIINLIFSTGVVPDHFKSSIVIPLHKSGSKRDCNNYRPISLTNNFSKIFEKSLKSRIVSFFESNKLLSSRQFGFREGLSTQNAISNLVDNIMANFASNRKCIAVFLDLQKAFDTVPHSILLSKIEKFGLRGTVHDIVSSFLLERTQKTKINDVFSYTRTVSIGLPQGTVLAPILFLIYINDLVSLPVHGKISAFADDTILLLEGESWAEIEHNCNLDLYMMQSWLTKNLLTLNVKKTKYMCLTPSTATQPNHPLNIRLHAFDCQYFAHHPCSCDLFESLECVTEFLYLGVIIDCHLKWRHHALYLSKKLRSIIPKLFDLRDIVDKRTLFLVYNALIYPLLNYAVLMWGGAYATNIYALNIAHKFVLKTMLKKIKTYPTDALFQESKVYTISQIFVLNCIIHIHIKNNESNYVNHAYATRAVINQEVIVPKVSKTLNIRYYKFLAPKYYNQLPTTIRNIQSYRSFKTKVKDFILAGYIRLL